MIYQEKILTPIINEEEPIEEPAEGEGAEGEEAEGLE